MAEEFRVLRPREYHSQLVAKGIRADGRNLEEGREVKLEIDAIRTADSSSLVKLGNTSLVCGCTSQVLIFNDKSMDNEGVKIKVELPPICSSPTGHKTQHTAQLLTRTLKNILDDSNCLDRQSLQIPDSDYYWSIDVEVICLNYDGCLLDASLIAVLSALKSLTLTDKSLGITPQILKLVSTPICSSYAMIGDYVICDPNLEEETIAESLFSITIDPITKRTTNINKIGGKSLSTGDLFKCIELAKQRADKLAPVVNEINKDPIMDCT